MFDSSRGVIFIFSCLVALSGGCPQAQAETADALDTSRLPRVQGAKEIFANPATTIFVSPDTVPQTADKVDKALNSDGWQHYVAPYAARANVPNMRLMSLKKGGLALNVMISVAPAQGNATSVQYIALPLKNDLPFIKDATDIEFDPNRPLLMLVTAESVDKILAFYRKELAARGWSLWSTATNGKQTADGPDGVVHESGAAAYYTADKNPTVTLLLTLQKHGTGTIKVEIKPMPVGILASLHQAYLNSDNSAAAMVKVGDLPRLDRASVEADRSTADRLVYSVDRSLASTNLAVKALLAAEGWKPYVAPLDDVRSTQTSFKKGRQGLSVSYTIQPGKTERTSERTTVYYAPTRLNFALPFPDDAVDIVFDENRPYLNAMTAGSVDSTLAFSSKELAASGWRPLSAGEAATKWPNAKIGDTPTGGVIAFFSRGDQRVIMLSLQRRDSDKTNIEIKVPPFMLPQTLEAGKDIYDLPSPKLFKTAGGSGGQTEHRMHAHVPAGIDTVLAFYRRALAARQWKEETAGAVIGSDQVTLHFTPPQGKAVLKLVHQYDLTVVSLVQQLPKPEVTAPSAGMSSIDSMLKQADQMMREATAGGQSGMNSPNAPQRSQDSDAPLRSRTSNDTPVPLPENAKNIEFDRDDGKLEFSSPSSVKSVADFYRSTMKQRGWQTRASVINNANMVVLNFAKGRNAVSFTIMKMGNNTNVSADGSGLKLAATPSGKAAGSEATAQPASEDDLVAEESGGLPVPKRHTMAVGTTTPFRHELNANAPLDLSAVLGFYRRELGKLDWKEETGGPAPGVDRATLRFRSPNGPAVLKLGRKDGETTINLMVKDPAAAKKAGIAPNPGRTKILFGNILPDAATMTFNKKTIKIAAGAGTKAPNGPSLDLVPGRYRYSIIPPGRPAQNDEIEVGADETWGLMVGPGGVLALQAY